MAVTHFDVLLVLVTGDPSDGSIDHWDSLG